MKGKNQKIIKRWSILERIKLKLNTILVYNAFTSLTYSLSKSFCLFGNEIHLILPNIYIRIELNAKLQSLKKSGFLHNKRVKKWRNKEVNTRDGSKSRQ